VPNPRIRHERTDGRAAVILADESVAERLNGV
jgi:hypothetical protein